MDYTWDNIHSNNNCFTIDKKEIYNGIVSLIYIFSILLLLDFLANVEIIFCWNIWERMTWNSFIRNKFTLKIESTLKQSHFLITFSFIALKMINHHRFKIALFCGLYPEGKSFFEVRIWIRWKKFTFGMSIYLLYKFKVMS